MNQTFKRLFRQPLAKVIGVLVIIALLVLIGVALGRSWANDAVVDNPTGTNSQVDQSPQDTEVPQVSDPVKVL